MGDRRFARIVQGHFRKATREPNEYLIFAMNPSKINEIYVLVRNMSGDDGEWDGGNFLFRMVLPSGFPTEPPSFYAMNENGVYGVEQKCCIAIGEFHSADYRPVLGVTGFARELANGMIGWKYLTEKFEIKHFEIR